jgi:cytochrome c oxidase assembly protein subunit 15
VVVALTVALWFVLRAVDAPTGPQHRTRELFLVLMSQGVIGYIQYFTDLPEAVVALHMFGASLVWIATLRVLLSFRERPAVEPGAEPEPEPGSAQDAGVREAGAGEPAVGGRREPVDAARVPLPDQGGDPLSVRR